MYVSMYSFIVACDKQKLYCSSDSNTLMMYKYAKGIRVGDYHTPTYVPWVQFV